jgi:hypothetical protein
MPVARPQSITGQISGTVTDPDGAVVVGATVQLTNDLTQQVRTFTTEANGTFIFTDLVAGDYSVHIALAGFKSYEQKAINVSTAEKVALHDIRLAVGDVNTSVTVPAEIAHVATDSSDRSVLVNTTQIENTPVPGRDFMGLMQSMPGVVDLTPHDARGNNTGMPTINGGQSEKLNIFIDGIKIQDSGNTTYSGNMAPSMDAIAEVKVMVSNFTAEYGGRAGGEMNVIVKNGTNQFHGSLYYFFRNEYLNANDFFNNQAGLPRAYYRYNNPGGTFGGPLLIPGTNFNRSRTKLFFFFSEDYLRFLTPVATSKQTMPTALERSGNFSQTDTTTGKLIPIKDPTTGQQFPGNIIPTSRISPSGWAMLNLFPMPNATDPTGQRQYNALYQFSLQNQQEDRILRLDYNVSPSTQAFVRLINDYQSRRGFGATHSVSSTWGQMAADWGDQCAGAVATIIHTFRPNLVNEFTAGVNHTRITSQASTPAGLAANQLPALKGPSGQSITLPNSYNNNTYDLIPNIRFANLNAQSAGQAITNPPIYAWDTMFPQILTDQMINVADNISWVTGNHTFKAGFYLERMARNNDVAATYGTEGTYYFGSDTANPNDTGYPYSNALLGSVQAYGEDNQSFMDHGHYSQPEWYVQDSWRVTRRVSLDLGIRFMYPGTISTSGVILGMFEQSQYNAAQAGQLLYPAVVNGQNVSINRATGAVYQLARAGSFDPLSYSANGNPYSGMVESRNIAFANPGLATSPRVGFAWDVLGNGKMALRGGFGIFYSRPLTTDIASYPMTSPPGFQAPVYYNNTFTQLPTASGFLSPQTVYAGTSYKNPSTYNWSLGVQRDLGKGMILEVAYIGNLTHHGFEELDTNLVAPYTTWTPSGGANPAYLDPTTGGKAFYTTNLLRPILGYGSINTTCSCGESKYDSLQTQLNRRFGKRLQFGANWTWSKTLSYTRAPWVSDSLDYAEVAASRPQTVYVNYSYKIPDGSRIWKNAVTKAVLDGWHFNGITKFMSGNPLTVACTAQSAPIGYWTGSPTGGIPFRCEMLSSNPWLPAGSPLPATAPKGLYYPLNVANFALPPATSLGIGNTPPTLFHGPGFENFDFTLLKDMRLGSESRVLEFRAEAYNALNHFNPGNPNTSLTLNYATGANTNANFGTVTTAVGEPRRMALGLKFRF